MIAAALAAAAATGVLTWGQPTPPQRLPDLAISQPDAFCAGARWAVQHDGGPFQRSPTSETLTVTVGDESIECPAQDAPVVHSPRSQRPPYWQTYPLTYPMLSGAVSSTTLQLDAGASK